MQYLQSLMTDLADAADGNDEGASEMRNLVLLPLLPPLLTRNVNLKLVLVS